MLPGKELNLDGMVPPLLVELHKRRVKRSEHLKLHLKHHEKNSELYLPEGSYRLYNYVVRECGMCQKTKPFPSIARFSGVRAVSFGDVVFMDHC